MILAFFSTLTSLPCFAFQLDLTASAIQQSGASYHYTGGTVALGFGSPAHGLSISFGATPPSYSHGFRQIMGHSAVTYEWRTGGKEFFKFFLGLGAGVYADIVQTTNAWVPSLVARGGIRIGFQNIGLIVGMDNYVGIYDPSHLIHFTVWPYYTFNGGLYFAI